MASLAAFATTRPSALEEAACSDSHCDGDAFVAVVISFLLLIFDWIFYLLLISCYLLLYLAL